MLRSLTVEDGTEMLSQNVANERADYLAKTAASYITTIAYDEIPINRGKQILEDHYIKIWNEICVKSENASHTKLYVPTTFRRLSFTLWPNFLLTQFLTNHGSFRSYLYKMNKTTSPYCNCPAKTIQTANHLPPECSLWSKDRPTVLKSLPWSLVLHFHINTVTSQTSSDASSKHSKKTSKENKSDHTLHVHRKHHCKTHCKTL